MNTFMTYVIGTPKELYNETKAPYSIDVQKSISSEETIGAVMTGTLIIAYIAYNLIGNDTTLFDVGLTSIATADFLTRSYNKLESAIPAGIVGSVRSWFSKDKFDVEIKEEK